MSNFARVLASIAAFLIASALAAAAPAETTVDEQQKAAIRAALFGDFARLDETLRLATAFAQTHPTDVEALCLLADAQTWSGRIREAGAALERARGIAPNDARIYFSLWWLCEHSPNREFGFLRGVDRRGALDALVRCTELDPKYADAWFNRAVCHALQWAPELEAARDAYRKYLALGAPPDATVESLIHWKP